MIPATHGEGFHELFPLWYFKKNNGDGKRDIVLFYEILPEVG
jgi:hypothetical protein